MTKHETLYNEEHGATLKHKCGEKDSSNCPFFLFLFLGLFFLWPFLTWDNALNDDHHTFITTRYYNKYDSTWMPLAVYRDVQ